MLVWGFSRVELDNGEIRRFVLLYKAMRETETRYLNDSLLGVTLEDATLADWCVVTVYAAASGSLPW